jgi:hypothetical protein
MAKARAFLLLELEAYEASALLAFLELHTDEFQDPDKAGGSDLADIAEAIGEAIPQMSYVPPIEGEEPEEASHA